jgi:hypothetical protein
VATCELPSAGSPEPAELPEITDESHLPSKYFAIFVGRTENIEKHILRITLAYG